MHYTINKKNIKQSIKNLNYFFKENNFQIPLNILSEAFSKSLFFKNYNTLEGITSKPKVIQSIPEIKNYMIEIDCSLNKNDLLNLIKKSFEDGKCNANIDNFLSEDKSYHLEISFPQNTDNFLTAMFLLASSLKNYNVTRFELLRIVFEKENLLPAVNLDFYLNNKPNKRAA